MKILQNFSKEQEGCLVQTRLATNYVKVKMPDGHGEVWVNSSLPYPNSFLYAQNTLEINEASTINDILLKSCKVNYIIFTYPMFECLYTGGRPR